MSLLWSVGWVIAGPWYSLLQATLGFDAAYAVNFVTIIVLYSIATFLYWVWFGRAERAARLEAQRAGRPARARPRPADRGRRRAVEAAVDRRVGPPRRTRLCPMAAETSPAARQTAIPKNPGRRDLGMKATLLFPDREIVEKLLRPAHLHGLPDLLLRARARRDLPPGRRRRDRPGPPAEAHPGRHRVGPRLARSSTSSSPSASAACRGPSRTSSSATGPAWPSTSRASAT